MTPRARVALSLGFAAREGLAALARRAPSLAPIAAHFDRLVTAAQLRIVVDALRASAPPRVTVWAPPAHDARPN